MKFLARLALAPILALAYSLAACSPPTMGRLGRGLGALLLALGFRKKIVETNLTLALGNELSAAEIERLVKQVYSHIGTLFLEIARNFGLSRQQMCEEIAVSEKTMARLNGVMAQGKGAVFITGHIANWELFAMAMAVRGVPLSLVVKKMNNALSQALIERQRERTGLEIIYSGGAIEKMKEALGRGRGIGFMVDQNTTGKKGIRVNFFHVPASSIRGLAALARDTGAPIVPVCAFRQPCGKHEMMIYEPLPYLQDISLPAGSPERLAREEWLNTQQYQASIESMVREHPDQWLWIHRRWKTSREPLNAATAHLENM
jgi:Kdo2-lipid IVA lauroyltransferase/acyltransferase